MHFEANSSFQNKQITKRETLSIDTKASRAIKKVFPAGAFKLLKGKKEREGEDAGTRFSGLLSAFGSSANPLKTWTMNPCSRSVPFCRVATERIPITQILSGWYSRLSFYVVRVPAWNLQHDVTITARKPRRNNHSQMFTCTNRTFGNQDLFCARIKLSVIMFLQNPASFFSVRHSKACAKCWDL